VAEKSATRRASPPVLAAFSEPLLVARPFRVLELRLCILPLLAPATRERHPALPDRSEGTRSGLCGWPHRVVRRQVSP
jgi:hypothetical protein